MFMAFLSFIWSVNKWLYMSGKMLLPRHADWVETKDKAAEV